MAPDSKTIVTGARPAVYAGRFAGQVVNAGLPDACRVLDDWEVLPTQLVHTLRRVTDLIVLDPLSFPFESMTDEQWDTPLVVTVQTGFEMNVLDKIFGEPLFWKIGFFDRIVTGDDGLWRYLSRKYRWRPSQRVPIEVNPGAEAMVEAVAGEISIAERESTLPELTEGRYEPRPYWTGRGRVLAHRDPRRAICSSRPGLPLDKAMHREQSAALEPRFAAARGGRAADAPFDVLEVGTGVGRWAAGFDPAVTRFHGADVSEDMLSAARVDSPHARFDLLGADFLLPYDDESFDLVFTVDVLHHNPTPAKKVMLSEMWRVTRPGGRLLFLEDFVAERWSPQTTVYPTSIRDFVALVMEASAGQVTLEHMKSLRYPGDDVSRAGLLELSRLGVPKRW